MLTRRITYQSEELVLKYHLWALWFPAEIFLLYSTFPQTKRAFSCFYYYSICENSIIAYNKQLFAFVSHRRSKFLQGKLMQSFLLKPHINHDETLLVVTAWYLGWTCSSVNLIPRDFCCSNVNNSFGRTGIGFVVVVFFSPCTARLIDRSIRHGIYFYLATSPGTTQWIFVLFCFRVECVVSWFDKLEIWRIFPS